MKLCGRMFFLHIVLLFYSAAVRAAMLGSPYPAIQKNFNRLLTTNACPSCDLRGAVMNRLNLSGADLQGANLTGAQLNFAVLNRAKLRNADLHGAWLIGADLAEADLIGTILEGMGTAAWSGKTEQKNTRSSPQQDTALPDLFADWQLEETSRRSVDEIPVIEASSVSNKVQEICFWHYLLGLKMKQKAAQERHQLDVPLNNEEQSFCVIPCPVPNTTDISKTSQSSQGRK